jgi:hypothetical protein
MRFVSATSSRPFWLASMFVLSSLLVGCASYSAAAADLRDGGLPRCPPNNSEVPSGAQFVHMSQGTHRVFSGMNDQL